MSEAKDARRTRPARTDDASSRTARNFVLAAQADNVVLVDAGTGRSWALGTDAGHPVWQPIAFKGGAERAPRGGAKDEEE